LAINVSHRDSTIKRPEEQMFGHAMEVRAQPLSMLLAHIVRAMRAVLGHQHVLLKTGND
jgi:hypothetical protein